MSIPFSVAATLARGKIEEDNYLHTGDPDIIRLVNMIDLKADAELTAAFPGSQGAEVTVRLRSGTTIRRRLNDVIAATPQDVRARFHRAASAVMGSARADELEELVDRCDSLSAGGNIASHCRPELSQALRSQTKAGLEAARATAGGLRIPVKAASDSGRSRTAFR